MPTLKTMMKRNEGLVGHVSVAEALELDVDDVAEWADGAELPCVDGVRVFMAEDVAELELQLVDGDDESADNPDYGANCAVNGDDDEDELAGNPGDDDADEWDEHDGGDEDPGEDGEPDDDSDDDE